MYNYYIPVSSLRKHFHPADINKTIAHSKSFMYSRTFIHLIAWFFKDTYIEIQCKKSFHTFYNRAYIENEIVIPILSDDLNPDRIATFLTACVLIHC